MARRAFQGVAFLLFGYVPLAAVVYALDAGSLPSSLVARFDPSGTPITWIPKSRFLGLCLACMLLIAIAGSSIALLIPEGWVPDLTSWVGLVGPFAVARWTSHRHAGATWPQRRSHHARNLHSNARAGGFRYGEPSRESDPLPWTAIPTAPFHDGSAPFITVGICSNLASTSPTL